MGFASIAGATATRAAPTRTSAAAPDPQTSGRAAIWSNNMSCQTNSSDFVEIESPWKSNRVLVDGTISSGDEWSDAHCLDLTLRIPEWGNRPGETISARWWVKNDEKWLYTLVRVPTSELRDSDNVDGYGAGIWYFWPTPYVDHWDYSDESVVDQDSKVSDSHGWDDEEWTLDVEASPPGETNIYGVVREDTQYIWFEFRKELDSGDGYDWSLAVGDDIGDGGALHFGVWGKEDTGWFQIIVHLYTAAP